MATFNLVADTRLRQLVGRTGSDVVNNLGFAFTIDTHTCFGTGATTSTIISSVTGSSTLGGDIKIRGDQTRLVPFDTGSGTVPAYDTVITGSGGGSGLLQGVYTAALNAAPLTPGAAMPASGYFLLSEWNSVTFPDNNTLTGISAIVCIDHILGSGTDRWGWIETVGTRTYIGNAAIGSAESASVWQIKVLDTPGLTKLWADGNDNFDNVWDDRATVTYS